MTEQEELNQIGYILDDADYLGCASSIVRDAMLLIASDKSFTPLEALEWAFEGHRNELFNYQMSADETK